MNTLLRFLLFNVVLKILLIEVFVMLLFVVLIIITKFINKKKCSIRKKNQKEISTLFEKVLFSEEMNDQNNQAEFKLPKRLCHFRNIVEVVEKFDQRFVDEKWLLLKEKVFIDHLKKDAIKNTFSRHWFTRQLAARAFLFSPKKTPVDCLTHLLEDSYFLVRIVASLCIIKSPYKELFSKMIKKMGEESDLSQYPYRDALIESDQEKFIWMEELLKTSTDEKTINICIDILSTREWDRLPNLVEKYLYYPNKKTRLLSIRALGSVPSEKSITCLKKHLQDSDWEIRKESIMGLKNLYITSIAPDLEPFLNDPSWHVRKQAAITLKSFGEQGEQILRRQTNQKAPQAYEISQYALALP